MPENPRLAPAPFPPGWRTLILARLKLGLPSGPLNEITSTARQILRRRTISTRLSSATTPTSRMPPRYRFLKSRAKRSTRCSPLELGFTPFLSIVPASLRTHLFRLEVRSESQIMSWLFGEATFNAS